MVLSPCAGPSRRQYFRWSAAETSALWTGTEGPATIRTMKHMGMEWRETMSRVQAVLLKRASKPFSLFVLALGTALLLLLLWQLDVHLQGRWLGWS